MDTHNREQLQAARRIVVKIGTNTLTDDQGHVDLNWLRSFAREVCDLRNRKTPDGKSRDVLIVCSGAIGAGCVKMNLSEKPTALSRRQAAAAVGQVALMRAWERAFEPLGILVGQILLTKEGLNDRSQYLNARNTIQALLDFNAIPIINENDTVSVDEIKIGDNDTLSAHVALLVDADLLVLLTDQEGVRERDPALPDAPLGERIGIIPDITEEIRAMTRGGKGSTYATGGMATKLAAAKIVTESGISMIIAQGRRPGLLSDLMQGKDIGTWFPPSERMRLKKRWLAYSRDTSGRLTIDNGAVRALVENGRSLLAVGIREVSGNFQQGDSVDIVDQNGKVVAKGLVNYSSEEIALIQGLQKNEIQLILHDNIYDSVVHRDNLAILPGD